MTKEDFIYRARKVHGDKYGYVKSVYVNYTTPLIITCPVHGDFEQSPMRHLYKKHGCPKCGIERTTSKIKFTNKDFIERSKSIHGNKYDYSESVYTMGKEPITIICPIHGRFRQRAITHMRGTGCPLCGIESRKISKGSMGVNDLMLTSKDKVYSVWKSMLQSVETL